MRRDGRAQPADSFENNGEYYLFGGSCFDAWNSFLAEQAARTLVAENCSHGERKSKMDVVTSVLAGIGPKDELEGMMAAQLIAAHNATMECHRRAMLPEQTFEGRREALNQASKLSRTSATLLDALNKHRGKGQQKVTVEHVHVYAGGQAVVGNIEQKGGGGQYILEEQPHAQQIAYAPEPAMRGDDAGGDPVPIPRDGELSMPNAWWKIDGGTDGER